MVSAQLLALTIVKCPKLSVKKPDSKRCEFHVPGLLFTLARVKDNAEYMRVPQDSDTLLGVSVIRTVVPLFRETTISQLEVQLFPNLHLPSPKRYPLHFLKST